MPRHLHRLTEVQARTSQPHERMETREYKPRIKRLHQRLGIAPDTSVRRWTRMLCDGGGLYLQVSPGDDEKSIRRSWIFRYAMSEKVISKNGRQRQRERQLGLGSLHDINLTEARDKAQECRKLLLEGVDPLLARRVNRANNIKAAMVTTFDAARDAYVQDQGDKWKSPRHGKNWMQSLEDHISPVFGKLPVASIDAELLIRALRPIWKTTPATASRVRGRVEAVLDWAKVNRMRDGENPARWKGHLDHVFAKVSDVRPIKPMAALPFRDIATFMSSLRQRSTLSAKALEFQILTATRTGEVIQAGRSEIDFENRVWTIPAAHTKLRREHKVPLSDAAIAALQKLDQTTDCIFPINNTTMMKFLRRGLHRTDITIHGFRSTFRDWAAETTDFPNHVVEMALAHSIGNQVEAAYRRGDLLQKRRHLMNAWADYCAGAVSAPVELAAA